MPREVGGQVPVPAPKSRTLWREGGRREKGAAVEGGCEDVGERDRHYLGRFHGSVPRYAVSVRSSTGVGSLGRRRNWGVIVR